MKTIGFFNNKGGVGKTTLVYHVAWMLSELGVRTIAVDLDPQANLTSMFLEQERLEEIWATLPPPTIDGFVSPLFEGLGDILPPIIEEIGSRLGLIVGDLSLSRREDALSAAWPGCANGDRRAFRDMSSFARTIDAAGTAFDAAVALIDVGPNLGSLNRAVLLGCDFLVVPLGADLFSLQGLRNMGPALKEWQNSWHRNRDRNPDPSLMLPTGTMAPAGYVVMRHSISAGRPARAFSRWIARMPAQYREYIMHDTTQAPTSIETDPDCLAVLKDYRSLMPLAQEARKPMFKLGPADGAFGGHQAAVRECWGDFRSLTLDIMAACGVAVFA
jgi:cellulose biosynthesis protein BcsQ